MESDDAWAHRPLDRDYGELEESRYLPSPSDSANRSVSDSRFSNRADSEASIDDGQGAKASNAAKWIQSTKDWLKEKMAVKKEPQTAKKCEATFESLMNQQRIPVVSGTVVDGAVDPTKPWTRALFRSLAVRIPPSARPGEEFVVAFPTGEARLIPVPLSLVPGDLVTVLYNGHIDDEFGVCFRDDKDVIRKSGEDGDGEEDVSVHRPSKELPIRLPPEERLVNFYRKHSPEDREAILERSEYGFNLKVYDGEYGVHVHHAAFVGIQTMLAADDVVIGVNEQPVQNVEDFKSILATIPVGDFASLSILRRSPPPVQRCPEGHPLILVGPRDSLPIGSRCNRCHNPLWDVFRVHRCDSCDWALCDECYKSIFETLNTAKNANRGDPEWAKDYEEDFHTKLTFSNFDRGARIRIYWHTTGEWWLGEVLGFHPERGHEILYEEGSGEEKQRSKQTIPDISMYTYQVLKKKNASDEIADCHGLEGHGTDAEIRQSQTEKSHSHSLFLPGSDAAEFDLTEDEQSLLEGIEADLLNTKQSDRNIL